MKMVTLQVFETKFSPSQSRKAGNPTPESHFHKRVTKDQIMFQVNLTPMVKSYQSPDKIRF